MNGLIAGAISGIITCIYTYATLPTVDEVINITEGFLGDIENAPEGVLRSYISIALKFSGIIALIFMLILGAVFGALHESIDKRVLKLKSNIIFSAIATGALMLALLVLPNVPLGASFPKILGNFLTGISYTLTLAILSIMKNPRKKPEEPTEKNLYY